VTPRPSRLERRIAAVALFTLAAILGVVTVLYTLRIIESGASVLILGLGAFAAIVIALRAYGRRN
jgi:heme A synthase